jgi:transcriptional regulator with GAF, ATPase, and Fis domain
MANLCKLIFADLASFGKNPLTKKYFRINSLGIMEHQLNYSDLLNFFRFTPSALTGDPDYNDAFCKTLIQASACEEASIWQLDSHNQLHPVYGTNFSPEEVKDVILREGEGIGGAVVLSRQTMAVSHAPIDSRHDQALDSRIGFQTRSMISAPILFGDNLFGVINILNHASGSAFPELWQERLSAVAVMYATALTAAGRMVLYDASSINTRADHQKEMPSAAGGTTVVGVSCAIQEALNLCVKAAKTDIPVLIRGATGTGKELAARRIHEASQRSSGPFVDVNCAAVAESLLESELFGHVKGAFSGATRSRQGKFLAAEGGTLFLDEIGDMSRTFQAKILRVLQEKKLSPVGSEKIITGDVRFVAATNQNLLQKVQEGTFREDLFYRLCGIEIVMPPLRDRPEDIPLLARYFLNRACRASTKADSRYQCPEISNQAFEMLTAFSWPGNVRQLEQAVLAAFTICESDQIKPGDFPAWLRTAIKSDINPPESSLKPGSDHRPEKMNAFGSEPHSNQERNRYMAALETTKYAGTGRWNISAAARQLGVPRKTLIYRLKKLRLLK